MDKMHIALAYYATAGEGMSEQETRQKVKEAIKRTFEICKIKNTEPIVLKKEIMVYDKEKRELVDLKKMPLNFIYVLRKELQKQITKNN